ncbi:MAG: (Fe-S)-binding protein [Promethearchaeota archaeon]|nr:MAG: (Fe-S)-binding protein [Candidatus Lokiarchaeota archaeon]
MTETKDDVDSNAKNSQMKITEKVKDSISYCFNCNRCTNVCPLSHLDIFSPRQLINDLSFLPLQEALENNNIWRCLTCGQCNEYCPMTKEQEGVNIPDLILELRKFAKNLVYEKEKIEQSETHDGMFSLITEMQVKNPSPPNKLDFLSDTGLKTAESGEIAYFVGCLPFMEEILFNLGIKYSDIAKSIIGLLNEGGIKPVVLNEKCCGHDILWGQADKETFKKLAEYNVDLYREAGVKTIIVGCAEGYRTWKIDYPKIIKDFDFEVLHFSEFLLKNNILDNLRFPRDLDVKVTYHDPCRLGRLGDGLYDAPRTIIEQIPGVELVEMDNIREDANCCGVSAFSGCNEYTRILRKNRIEEAINTGAEYLLVACPKCLSHFNCYLDEPTVKKETQNKEKQIKIRDIASFLGELLYLT